MLEHEIPPARPKFAVETSWHGRKDNAVCILDVLFQKKTLVFREEVFATMSFAMNAYETKVSDWHKAGGGGEGGVQIVTSQGSANFQKAMGSKREAMCWYSVGSLRDFGHACIMSWTGKSWSCTSSMVKVFSNVRGWDGRDLLIVSSIIVQLVKRRVLDELGRGYWRWDETKWWWEI
jgi:hypothetical protein